MCAKREICLIPIKFCETTPTLFSFILIKGIYKGNNAIIYSFLTAFIVVSISFIILNGFNRKTLTALVGSFGGIVISGILALIFNNMSKLSGAGEDIMQLTANLSTINYNFRDRSK